MERTYACYKDGCIDCFDYFMNREKEYVKLLKSLCLSGKPIPVCWCDCDKCCQADMEFNGIDFELFVEESYGLPGKEIGDDDVFYDTTV